MSFRCVRRVQYKIQFNTFFMLGNIESSSIQLSKKQSFFRNKIRRQQINAYFEMRRKEIKARTSTIILSSESQKEYFLEEARRKLIEGNQREREKVLAELKKSVGAFEGQFDLWVNGPLTGLLLNAFQAEQQFKEKIQIAKLFIQIFQNCSQTRCKWVQILRSRKIHQNLVKSLKSTSSNPQKHTYLKLLGCLCRTSSYLRDWIVVSTEQQFLNYGEFINQQNGSELLAFLSIVVDYIAILVVPENIIKFAPIGFVIKIMPLLMRFLVGTKDIKIAVELLMTLRLAVKPRNQIVFSHFTQNQLSILFYLLQYQQTKISSLNLINYISSSSSSRLAEELLNRGIVSVLQRQIESSGREKNILKISFNILEHLATTQQEAFSLIEKLIWKEGISALNHTQESVKEQAYYFVEAILNAIDNPEIQLAAIKKGGIVHIIMSQLCQVSKTSQITLIAMRILQLYIRSQQSCGNDPKNFLFLETIYRFSQILDDIYMRSCRQQIQLKAEVLSSLFAEATVNPYTI